MKNYLHVNEGKNSALRYLSSVLVTIAFVFAGSIVYVMVELLRVALDGNDNTYMDAETGTVIGGNGTVSLLMTHIMYLFALLGLWISVRFILKRKFRTLVTAEQKINWKKIFLGFSVFSCLYLLSSGVDFIFNSSDYIWNDVSFSDYVFLVIVVLIFVPIQTTTEELIFRGLLLQWVGKMVKKPFWLALIIGAIFGSLHFSNPEMDQSVILVGLDYIVAGFALTYIAAKTGSLELSIGAHAANNMMIFLLFTFEDSVAGDIPSLFRVTDMNPFSSLIWSVIIFALFYLWSRKLTKKETL